MYRRVEINEDLQDFIANYGTVHGGFQTILMLPNGYGASVIQHYASHGSSEGKHELAVLYKGALCYNTPIFMGEILYGEYTKHVKTDEEAEETFIAHSNKGYMLTKDTSIIKDSLNDYKRRAFAQLKNYWHGMKSIGAQLNLNFDEEFKQYARKE